MSKIKLFLVITVVLYFTGFNKAVSGEEADNQQGSQKQFLITLDITDGSRVVGAPSGSSVTLNTSFAKLDIPWEKIQSIELKEDKEAILVKFQNGDKLTGALDLKTIELKTIFGEVSIGIQQAKKIIIQSSGILPRGGLIAYYSFDGNVNDESGNGNNGTLRGNAVISTGAINSGVVFDGNGDHIKVPSSTDFNLTGTFTMNAWIYRSATGFSYQRFISRHQDTYVWSVDGTWAWGLGAGNTMNFAYRDGNSTIDVYSTPLNFSTGTWHHASVSRDENNIFSFYLDGTLVSTHAGVGAVKSLISDEQIIIGSLGGGEYLTGSIDEVRIYNRALSGSDIRELYILRNK